MNADSRRGYPIIKALACVYPEGEIRNDALAYVCNGRAPIAQPNHEVSSISRNDASNFTQRDKARAVGSLLKVYKVNASKYGETIKENSKTRLTNTCA